MSNRDHTQQTKQKIEEDFLIKDEFISYEIVRELIKMHVSDTNELLSKIEYQQRVIEKLEEELASTHNRE